MRIKTLGLILALSLGHSLPALADTAAPQASAAKQLAAYTTVEGITEYRLANGLRVLLAPDASKPTTTVNITYLVGSRHEGYGETGMAHLLEHLVFKGTHTSGNLMTELSKRGMQFNGTTFFDRTNYFETFPANESNLEWALRMEADRMINSKIAKSDLDTEFSVVRNEMDMGENKPGSALWKQLSAISFDWHNYGNSTIGARSDVEKVRIENLQAFYRKYYQPDNAVLMVSGKFDPVKTLALIQDSFGKIAKPQRVLVPTWTTEPQRDGAREVTVERVGDTKLAALLYHTAAGSHPDAAAMSALSLILGDTPSGRLYKNLVTAKKAVSVSASAFELAEPGYIVFFSELSKQQNIAEVRKVLQSTIEGIGKQPITQEELNRAKVALLKDIDQTLNNPQRLTVQLSESIAQGDWRLFFLTRDRIEALTVADVQRVAENYFKPSNRTFGQFLPTDKPNRTSIPETPDVAKLLEGYKGKAAQAEGENFDASPANIDKRTEVSKLSNGAKLALLSKKNRGETVFGVLTFSFGDEKSLFGKNMTGSLTGTMLTRGTDKLNREQIADRQDQLKANIGIGISGQELSVSFRTTRANLQPTLELIGNMLKKPSFPASEFELVKKQILTGIESQRQEPGVLAAQALEQKFNRFPKGDLRYKPTLDEAPQLINSVKLADLKKYHQTFLGAQHAELSVVGDFDSQAVKQQLNQLFGNWNSKAAYKRVPKLASEAKPDSIKLEAPDKANAVYLSGLPLIISDQSPDFPALQVGNLILGGGANSRLLERIRQKDGLSYGVGSSVNASSFEPVGSFGINAIFAPANLDKLKVAVNEELARILKDGVTEKELADAKLAIQQSTKVGLAQDSSLAGRLAGNLSLDRSMKFTADRLAAIDKLTVADVNAALRKYVDPSKLTHVYAGDFAGKGKKEAAKTAAK